MKTMKLHSFIIALLSVVFFASCNKEDIYPTFSFDANGECYIPDAANISTEEFESSVVGYGWKHVITYEIGSDGKCSTKDYYEDLVGGGPSQYYFESSESLKEYMYVDAFPAHGYHTYAYDYEDGNRVSQNGYLVMRIVSLKGDIMKIIDFLGIRADGVKIYGYSTYKRMNSKELKEIQNAYPDDLSNIKSLTTSINDEVNIISGNEFEFDVLSYNDLYSVKARNEESCEITCDGDHVKIKLLTNGAYITVSDRFRHFEFSLFSTDEDMEPKGTDIYDLSYNEVIFNKNMKFIEPSENRPLSYENSSIETTTRDGYAGSTISHYNRSYMLVVDTDKKARLIHLQNGRLYLKELLPKETLQTLIEKGNGSSISYKLELTTADRRVFQVLPFKVTYKEEF
ncbi:Uncharacterised protein [uncultured Bacteroides sp.]|uniref:hypothetical protein n=1 Tax=Bacteroides cellulolyticus TaxID=2981780 RepID=UPI000820B61A|nr:hypothetical protein [Bacteroides cellulolyticus]MCU6772414.1 hypothetical protein [Bacteroides cellulolyticus]SCI38271.1 Uncharacterised protein [uncultured Bacteroides sp.]